ncbi:oxidoreductase [Neoasaia chiangmaiensis NBRC 101099]|uniref:Oxidoreductase n=1 Tax=Neoasaia chiangmaiensis TaxID=320497 RepID=A0A1U9KQE4_9PROT|nr:SDR family oxidoreductase [Neoasaia chiangmaiensis]AQS88028.1 oxidoreductase [Neoasaia chiangmaiensis]GBR38824.1 oxidoreductase [Neoasaia chiangmaiensis NBRC 101099]GEN15698.1 dehydrogenase [Neoasaia chiangmaiensis]
MTTKNAWRLDRMPRLEEQVAVITGATGGLGFETARGLAERGARTILTGRNPTKGEAALHRLRALVPNADVQFLPLDLASLASVAAFVRSLNDKAPQVDILINNAGVMGPARRLATKDGFELQFGTNHLGHFALTGQLLTRLTQGHGLVVTVASLAAWKGKLPFDDLNAQRHYSAFGRYRQSKLANLSFALELDRRARAHGGRIHSRAAHPGWAMSDIIANSAALGSGKGRAQQILRTVQKTVGSAVFRTLGQDVAHGAEPLLYAALSPNALDGGYYGPQGRGERRGPPGPAPIPPDASDPGLAKRLWDASERLTGVSYDWEKAS